MNYLLRWFRQPQQIWLRRAFFQIHLWMGIGLSLYIAMISLTGSAIVFRREVNAAAVPVIKPEGVPLTKEELTKSIQRTYPDYQITGISQSIRRTRPASVALENSHDRKDRYFDPYTGRDIGEVDPIQVRVMEWMVDLHDNLLLRPSGKLINGVLSILVSILVLAGMVVWWPGYRRVFRSMILRRANWRSFNWQLHSAIGFWSLPIVWIWSITGIYFGFPSAAQSVAGWFTHGRYEVDSYPDLIIGWLVRMHFGRFGGLGVRITWVVMGIIPTLLLVTGMVMWWNRSLRRMMAKPKKEVVSPAFVLQSGQEAPFKS